ncbi:dTDP-4-amino-4,6-dideoxygalactose transaminase [Virgibacillus salexigens]|uniref:dTDP-4-amino-4,6-dideoxygalactose transaminase n=1 Tax=Virgibacillus kapii TaxID=1638645 RepID=A0ABQ2DJ11_9BACI|nr:MULTISPECIES: dTDP-4-amino-4,6-dideoxygalactose transaminase [Virgibacillus]MYL40352.1 dTDP-4-amino-4,6-dideoxygalactose transaminase [Virgibacillus massiliensis]GGJ59692.1 dTDP-4-amino-4,6-dideoxygalactose transaminase [Virgibacillus kapii]
MIPFNKPCVIGSEIHAIQQVITADKLSGNGEFGKKCMKWLEEQLTCEKALITPSCTAALELTALLTDIQPGDEVVMPSYTFVSTANAFVLRGASIRFVDIEPSTMNIDPQAIERAITEHTKAIVVVHYAGVGCDMDTVLTIANNHNLWVIEDAAQGLMSTYKGESLGTIGHLGTISFHDTKNYTCGEGGALLINDASLIERAEMIQEKGTNRSQFIRGEIDKYTWRDVGSSYLLSELNAAYLSVQFQHANEINQNRRHSWAQYNHGLMNLQLDGAIELPTIPNVCEHNAHMYYIKLENEMERNQLRQFLKQNHITAATHYVPLHTAHAGKQFGLFVGEDRYTTTESDRLLRLPLYYGIGEEAINDVVNKIQQYFQS